MGLYTPTEYDAAPESIAANSKYQSIDAGITNARNVFANEQFVEFIESIRNGTDIESTQRLVLAHE